jgi:membrane protease YdiL (CAAX protease family)
MAMKQLFVFLGMAYIISWIIWMPLYLQMLGIPNLPVLPFHHALGGLGPLISAFLTTWIFKKKKGLSVLLKKCIEVNSIFYLTIALLSPFVIAVIASVICFFVEGDTQTLFGLLESKEFPQFNILVLFLYNLFFFGVGEEIGWRGFALPRLQKKFNDFVSSILLTFFWAIWHLPLFFYREGYTSMDIVGISGWFFSLLTGSILLTWLYNSSEGSILVCAVFHSTIDIVFTSNVQGGNIVNYMGFLITVWGVLIVLIFKPKNLATKERTVTF